MEEIPLGRHHFPSYSGFLCLMILYLLFVSHHGRFEQVANLTRPVLIVVLVAHAMRFIQYLAEVIHNHGAYSTVI